MRGEVGVSEESAKYGYVQEYGRKPGKMPPVGAIKRWARIKLGDEGLGYPIARSIARKGTKPHPFFEPGIDESMPIVERLFEQAGTKIIQDI